MSANLVLLTQNRPRLLKQCLDSLLASDVKHDRAHGGDRWTLTVIDDGTTDNLAQRYLLDLPKPYCALEVFRNSSHNLGILKSAGVIASERHFRRGEWLCLMDNDCYFRPGWLERMIDMAEATEPMGFQLWGGQNHPFHARWDVEGHRMVECEQLAGTHMFMRWATWDTFGPLESNGPGVLMGEDVRFCEKFRATHARIGVAAPACVVDCGLTSSNGAASPGAWEKNVAREDGLYYE